MSVTASILMTVYNCKDFVATSLKSALAQQFDDFEVIVIDDGSTDGTLAYLRTLEDTRLRLFAPGRLGRQNALNFGLAQSSARYIAILDGDDVCLPERLAAQTTFLLQHPEVAVAGSRYRTCINEAGESVREDVLPLSHADIVARFKDGKNGVFHSSVMFNRERIQSIGGYDTTLPCAEDWDLYVRAVAAGFTLANIDQRLSLKRIHPRRFFGGVNGIRDQAAGVEARAQIRNRASLL